MDWPQQNLVPRKHVTFLQKSWFSFGWKDFLVWENLACLYFEKETPNGGKTVASTPMILVEMLNDLCPLVGFSPIKWKAYIWLSETSFSVWQLKACYCYHLGPSNHSSHLQLLSLSLKKKQPCDIIFFFKITSCKQSIFPPLWTRYCDTSRIFSVKGTFFYSCLFRNKLLTDPSMFTCTGWWNELKISFLLTRGHLQRFPERNRLWVGGEVVWV